MKFIHEIHTWNSDMKFRHEIHTWNSYTKFINEIHTWNSHMKFTHEIHTWNSYMKSTIHEIHTWNSYMKSTIHEIYHTWNLPYMKFTIHVFTKCLAVHINWRTPLVAIRVGTDRSGYDRSPLIVLSFKCLISYTNLFIDILFRPPPPPLPPPPPPPPPY